MNGLMHCSKTAPPNHLIGERERTGFRSRAPSRPVIDRSNLARSVRTAVLAKRLSEVRRHFTKVARTRKETIKYGMNNIAPAMANETALRSEADVWAAAGMRSAKTESKKTKTALIPSQAI